MPENKRDFPPTLSAQTAAERNARALRFRTVKTAYGDKPILTAIPCDPQGAATGPEFDFWGTPYMSRQLGVTPDPPTVKRPATRVTLPARIESYPTDKQTGYKLVSV